MSDVSKDELITFLQFRVRHYRELALRYHQELQALKSNVPEDCRTNSLTYKDRTGDAAVNRVIREENRDRKRRK